MNSGVIKVADDNGIFVIKMIGDVRLTLCVRFDEFIDDMLGGEAPRAVVFDLSDAEAIDSTTLGLMAKVSLKGRKMDLADPLVFSPNATIKRLLDTMGFAEILRIVDKPLSSQPRFSELDTNSDEDEGVYRAKVLEAHKILVELNGSNAQRFKDLIQSLEN